MRTLSASRRQALRLTVATGVATGVALAAYTLGSSAGANSSDFPRIVPATTSSTATDPGAPATATSEPATSSPLTLDQATAVAAQLAPGRVVKWDEDHEPTGLRYDITLLHDDGSTTDVEVDTVTGRVTSVDHDNDGD
jgi:uncharacterized membrane protein YkoI